MTISAADEARFLAAEETDETRDSICWSVIRLGAYVDFELRKFDLTRRKYSMLAVISHGPISLTTLARKCLVTPPSATIMARGLIAKGLVTRSVSAIDQRRVWIQLSVAGEGLLVAVDNHVRDLLDGIASLSPDAQGEERMRSLDKWGPALDIYRSIILANDGDEPERALRRRL